MSRDPRALAVTVALVAVGGAVGASARHLLGTALPGLWGTLAANVSGSLLLGFLLYEALRADRLGDRTRTLLATGVLSSYTTYSTFVVETVRAEPLVGVSYLLGSYALGFAAALLGRDLAARVDPRDDREVSA
ncbi:chromosome condensation protein CrcB [Halobaculum sp. WSA2]|uniref:Fluoride-specific ion channel FluC n=1 Tax=Halobaculum saliterrae TaxID=2073113 RepID=A0A6B0SYK1_9EURY|nr:CrcB family protein [Halobaculum saliterrae]MXR41050.1 chromosome condensation protein CrcB [Halobaculum saliterrae]